MRYLAFPVVWGDIISRLFSWWDGHQCDISSRVNILRVVVGVFFLSSPLYDYLGIIYLVGCLVIFLLAVFFLFLNLMLCISLLLILGYYVYFCIPGNLFPCVCHSATDFL